MKKLFLLLTLSLFPGLLLTAQGHKPEKKQSEKSTLYSTEYKTVARDCIDYSVSNKTLDKASRESKNITKKMLKKSKKALSAKERDTVYKRNEYILNPYKGIGKA